MGILEKEDGGQSAPTTEEKETIQKEGESGMIRAGSLVYALFVVTIVAMLCSAFVLASAYHRIHLRDMGIRFQQMANVESGINLLRGGYRSQEQFIERKTLFDEDPLNEVLLQRRNWGAFELLRCESKWKEQSWGKALLMGQRIDTLQDMALYLTDRNRPLSLSGETIIKGKVYIPKAGVKRAYIEGKGFRGSQLIQGVSKNSLKKLPELSSELLKEMATTVDTAAVETTDSIISWGELRQYDSLNWGFAKRTIRVEEIGDLIIDQIALSGNLIIKTEGNVTISNSASLEHVLVYAKEVYIEEGFEGNLQAFALDSMWVGKKCTLSYPSVLAVVGKTDLGSQLLEIDEECVIRGALLLHRKKVSYRDVSLLRINKNARIEGQVYSVDKVYLGGTVAGSIHCDAFTLTTPSSVYENHLLDATIDVSQRPQSFVGVSILTQDSTQHRKNRIVNELPL